MSVELDDRRVPLQEIMDLPRTERDFFLKYAGQDTNRNWGSMGVVPLSRNSQSNNTKLMATVSDDLEKREPWVLQVGRTTKLTNVVQSCELDDPVGYNLKMGSFHGPTGELGLLANLRRAELLVHGQSDTIFAPIAFQKQEGESLGENT